MKKLLTVIVVFVMLAGAAGIAMAYLLFNTEGSREDTVLYTIEPGTNLSEVAARLEDEGVIRNAVFFSMLARFYGADRRINAGPVRDRTGNGCDRDPGPAWCRDGFRWIV